MCRLFQRLQPGSKWIEASRPILLASQEIKVTSELQKLPDQQTKEVWHPFFPPTTVHQVFKSYRRVQSSNQAHFSLIKKLIPFANASKGDITVTTLWLYRDEICFMVISSLVCFTRWLTCCLMGLISPWQFGQFRYAHISTWSCLFEWQDSEFKLHLYVITMSTLFWEEGLHNNWIDFVVKQWNMAHATCFIACKASLGAFLLKGLTSSFAPPILTPCFPS